MAIGEWGYALCEQMAVLRTSVVMGGGDLDLGGGRYW